MEKSKREKQLNIRLTEADRELLRQLTAMLDEPSDTQTIVRMIREKAREKGLLK